MTDMHQRNAVEKEVILSEIQMLKQKAKAATNLTFLKETEKDYWNKLLDSNIRAGTMACMWCMKAQVVRRLSVAFFKWKYAGAPAVPTQKILMPQEIPMSTVLSNAITLMNQIKESEVEKELSTQLFMSPSASVQVANDVATSILQQDLQQHHLVPLVGSFRWENRRSRASSFGQADAPATAVVQHQEEESLAVHNRQRLAYLLHSLQQQNPTSLSADGSATNTNSVDAQLLDALQNPNVDAATKRDILIAMSQDLTTQTGALDHSADCGVDPAVAARSSLSLLRATGATPPASARRSQAATSARSLSPNGRMHARTSQSYSMGTWTSAAPTSQQQHTMSFLKDDAHAADSHSVGSGYRSTAAAIGTGNGHVFAPFSDISSLHSAGGEGRHRDSGNWREHEFTHKQQPSAAEEAFFARHNRTYPVSSSSGQAMSLRTHEVSSGNAGSSSKARGSLPRYLMPTNSYQKKRAVPSNTSSGGVGARAGSNSRGSRSSSVGRRSHSPSMITNSNSKHVANLRGGPYTAPSSRAQAIFSLQSPHEGRQRQPSYYEDRQSHSYANMSVFDYHQRSNGSKNGYINSARAVHNSATAQHYHHHQQEPHVHQQETQYYYNQPHGSHEQQYQQPPSSHGQPLLSFPPSAQTSLSLPFPPPFPAGATASTEANMQHVPLRDAALASIAEVDRMVPPQQGEAMVDCAPQHRTANYTAYDAYHNNALLTNSTEIQETAAAISQQKGIVNPQLGGRPRAESLEMLLYDDDPHRPTHYQTGSDYSAQYYQQPEHASLVQERNAAPRSAQSQNSRKGGGKTSGGSGGRSKPDKAQLALFMHGDVHGNAAKWHATLRR